MFKQRKLNGRKENQREDLGGGGGQKTWSWAMKEERTGVSVVMRPRLQVGEIYCQSVPDDKLV